MEADVRPQESLSFGTLLRRHRLAAGLSQEALAERARVSVEGISALERGFRRAPQRETLELLAGALALSPDQRRAFEDAAAAASPRRRGASVTVGPWPSSRAAILPRGLANFVGRETEIESVGAALSEQGAAAVYGLGGVGKSALAREYAWRSRERYSVTWWLNSESEDGIIDGLLGLGAMFVRDLDKRPDRRAAARHVVDAVLPGFEKPALLVFDNVEEESDLRTWLPRKGAHALITSRYAVMAGMPTTALQAFPLETAIEYLQRESTRSDLTEDDARAISEALGALPLALSHAAASLRTMRMLTPQRYLKHIAAHLNDAPAGVEYPQSVFATFRTAIAQVEREAAGALAALCFAASFAPDAIPDELFRQPVENYADGLQPSLSGSASVDLRSLVADEVRLDGVLGALDRISLLVYSESSRTYSIHRLVQLAARDLIAAEKRAWYECVVAVADAAFPESTFPDEEYTTWPQRARLLHHMRAALDALPSDAVFAPAGRLAYRCGVYLRERGEFDAAEALIERALAIHEKLRGEEHPDVVQSKRELALVYADQSRYEAAEALLTHVLDIWSRTLGSDDVEVSRALNSLSLVYLRQGRYAEAETLLERSLGILERELANHPLAGRAMNNLAMVRFKQGRYGDAESLLTRVLAIEEKALGPEHPDVGRTLNNLSDPYQAQGRYEEAAEVLRRALEIFETALSPDHPAVGSILSNISLIYSKQERYEDAEPPLVRGLAILENSLGSDHPEIGTRVSLLAGLYRNQGRHDEAEERFAQALSILEKTLGPDHDEVAITLCDLAGLREIMGRDDDAKHLYTRALTIRQKALGADHPDTKALSEKLKA